ncbi:MAG TPA: haloalkane dehalogenase [Kofleriaceae bacterium]|nr:haloalkane dehalogenase [Kofleriaceae bacterium]
MEILRTPDDRFAALPGYAFAPHYVQVGELRMHYVDEGPRDGAIVLCLHGEPSWSYLYRTMIPPLVAAGLRVVAPDLVGFGRSDKPASREDYTFQRHVDWMASFLDALGLRDLTLFCQDWGGLIGLRLVAEDPDRFARVVASNTFLPTGDGKPSQAFLAWRTFSQSAPEFPVGKIVAGGCARPVAPEVVAAYDAPFPDERYKAGARQFPVLVPATPDDPASAPNRAAWERLRAYARPFLTAFGDSDPITRGADARLQAAIPGAAGQPHTTVARGGHFIQEDAGEELADIVTSFIARTR